MLFIDHYHHVIDDKNRLAIPSPIRNSMNPETDGTAFYLVPEERYVQLVPEKLFESTAAAFRAGLAPGADILKARRLLFSTVSRVEPDKQGRIVIPDRFLLDAKNNDGIVRSILGRDVTLNGVGESIELWNRADFIAHMRELSYERHNLQAAMQKVAGGVQPATPAAV